MSYIKKGDAVKVYGKDAIAASDDYTKLVFDSYDIEMNFKWKEYEGGSARPYIDIEYLDGNGTRYSVPLFAVKKV